MHLRTFKGWIFKMIKLQDLLSDTVEGFVGDFFPASNDLAMYYPLVEMAHKKIHFIDNIIYTRNLYSNIVGFKVDRSVQLASAREIKRKKSYTTLQEPVYRNLHTIKKKAVDFVVCTYENSTCALLKKEHKNATIIQAKDINKQSELLLNDYVMILCDEHYCIRTKEIEKMIYQLERTFADGIFALAKKDFLNSPKNRPVACLEDGKLYACKNRFLQKVIDDTQNIKGIVLRILDFKRIIQHVGTIDNLVSFFLHNNDNDITLLYLS
jgi:hypothetical protein